MSPNTIFPFPMKSDTPSEKVRKTSADLDEIKQAIFTTNDTVVKEGNTEIFDKEGKSKQNVVEEAITHPISENKLTQSTKHRN